MAPSSSGLGRRPLKAKVAGSNPVGATKCSAEAFASAFCYQRYRPLLELQNAAHSKLGKRSTAGARTPNMSRALSRDKFGQTPCFSGPGLIIWPASLPRWTCLDRRASSQSNIRGFAGRAAAASDRRGSPPRALYVAGVASQFVATAGGVTFGLKSLPAGVPREQRPRE